MASGFPWTSTYATGGERQVRTVMVFALGLGLMFLGLGIRTSADPGETKPSMARVQMREIADGITMELESGGKLKGVERITDPIYIFGDPNTSRHDGTVWAWGRTGRPVALLSLAPQKADGKNRWLCELTALAATSVVAKVPNAPPWTPQRGSSIEFRPVPTALAPAEDETKRLRQMKEMARRFKGFEFGKSPEVTPRNRYELRLQVQPILRYSDKDAGLLDGAIFFLVKGTNPEVVLLLEARGDSKTQPVWTYGLTRAAGAELHVQYDNDETWTVPWFFFQKPRDSYWVFTRPLVGFEP